MAVLVLSSYLHVRGALGQLALLAPQLPHDLAHGHVDDEVLRRLAAHAAILLRVGVALGAAEAGCAGAEFGRRVLLTRVEAEAEA
jgi:hypothetical protein